MSSITLMKPVMSRMAELNDGEVGILLGFGQCAHHAVVIPEGHGGLMDTQFMEERFALWRKAIPGIEVVGWFRVRFGDGCWLDTLDLKQSKEVFSVAVIVERSEMKAFQLNEKQQHPYNLASFSSEERYRREYLPNRHLYHEIPILFKQDH